MEDVCLFLKAININIELLQGEYITTIAKIVIAITSKNIILLIPFIIEGNNILRIKTTPKATISFKAINYQLP